MGNILNRRAVARLRAADHTATASPAHVVVRQGGPAEPPSTEGQWERGHLLLTGWKAHGHLASAQTLVREGLGLACPGSEMADRLAETAEAIVVAMGALAEVDRLGRAAG